MPSAYAPLTANERCDRCGAQAQYVTAHNASTLMWCSHHYHEHGAILTGSLIYMQTQTKEPQPA